MPARSRRFALGLPVLLALALVAGGAPRRVSAASSLTYDTYFWSAYERQVDNRTCTAASTAMMMNILNGRDLNLDQLAILRYSQPRDALSDSVQRGTDPLGWARAATYFSRYTIRPTTYRWEAYYDGGGGPQAGGVPDRPLRQGGRAARPARKARRRDDRLHDDTASAQGLVQGDRDLLQ